MGYNLFLDDIRQPCDAFTYITDYRYNKLNWSVVRNYEQFISIIKNQGVPDLVSFDHDLSYEHYDLYNKTDYLSYDEYYNSHDREMTGYDCAKWLCDYVYNNNLKFPEYMIHSYNKIGSINIDKYIKNFLKHNPNNKK